MKVNKKVVNILIVGGSGFWSKQNHIPALISLKKEGIPFKLIAICDTINPFDHITGNSRSLLELEKPAWLDAGKSKKYIFSELERINTQQKIDLMIIATSPIHHYEYAVWGLKRLINIICDKPIVVVKNSAFNYDQALSIYNKFTNLQELITKAKSAESKNKNYLFSTPLRRRALTPFLNIADGLTKIYEQTGEGIRHMNVIINNGINKYPVELLNDGAHGYLHGVGSLSHSSYHYIDIIAWYLTIAPGKAEKIRIDTPYVYRVSDYLKIEGYKFIQDLIEKKKLQNNITLNKAILASELDFKFNLRLLDKNNNLTGLITYSNNHTSFTPRLSKYNSRIIDYANDKNGGRMSQVFFDIHQGAIQNFQLVKNDVVFTPYNIQLFARKHPRLGKIYSEKTYKDAYIKNTFTPKDLVKSVVKQLAGLPIDHSILTKLSDFDNQILTNKIFSAFYELIANEYLYRKGISKPISKVIYIK